ARTAWKRRAIRRGAERRSSWQRVEAAQAALARQSHEIWRGATCVDRAVATLAKRAALADLEKRRRHAADLRERPARRIARGNRIEEAARIGMPRMIEHIVDRARFDHPSRIHDADFVGE